MTGSLLDVAKEYEREADKLWTAQQARWALRDTAALFRRMVSNRAAADPTKLKLSLALPLDIPHRWCRRHGYRAVAGADGLVVQRNGEPALVAAVGDTLLWDGERLTVQTRVEAGRETPGT